MRAKPRSEAGVKADIQAVSDRGETVAAMEPLRIAEGSPERIALTDLALSLVERSAGFRRSLPVGVSLALADLVRAMNCYYSNLIEGHDTHPIDIERALKNDYSKDARKRNLQHEAKAHIEVQSWIDAGALTGWALTAAAIREVHARFCSHVPSELLWVEDAASGRRLKVIPGEFRARDVELGAHRAVSPGALPRFMERYEGVYG